MLTTCPFWHLGEDEVFVSQMIGFIEGLPAAWQPKWEKMKRNSKHILQGEGKPNDINYKRHLLLTVLKDDETGKMQQKLGKRVTDPMLAPLVTIIQGRMRFLPSTHMTVDEALWLLQDTAEEEWYE